MRFSEYFGAWIRAYYASVPLGRDFYTAVGASKFFGGAIAKYILQSLESSAVGLPLNIIDLGANNANLLQDIRAFLGTLGVGVVENCDFIAVESNASALSLQNSAIIQQSTTLSLRDLATPESRQSKNIIFYKNLAELKSANLLCNRHNIFIANEFFDALPCEIIDNGKMAFVKNNRLIFKICDDEKILEICEKFAIKKGEIPLIYDEFCENIKSEKFIFIAFDYGDIAPRNDFSLRLFYNHKIKNFADIAFDLANQVANQSNITSNSANLGENPTANLSNLTRDSPNLTTNLSTLFGKCDITYSVPFFVLDRAFERICAKKILSKRQDLALIEDFGILDLLQDFHDSLVSTTNRNLYLRESNKIKTLLHILSPKFHTAIYKNF